MKFGAALYWGKLISQHLTSQAVIQALNLLTGFLLLRCLSVPEYAIYILALVLVSIASLGSDMGVSQGVVSIGAPIREDESKIASLLRSAIQIRRFLFGLVSPIVVVFAVVLFRDYRGEYWTATAVTVLALAVAWIQQSVTVLTSTSYVYHDAPGLAWANGAAAIFRLCLVVTVCIWAPFATTALAINLAGLLLCNHLLRETVERRLVIVSPSPNSYIPQLKRFMLPLVPGLIYYVLQGHISTVLLWISGLPNAVAEVGALSRLGQIVGLLTLINGFFIQPYFSRITSKPLYVTRLFQVIAVLALVFSVLTISVLAVPHWWLLILGPHYSSLTNELRIAIYAAQLSTAGAILYTITVAGGRTHGQWWQIVLGVGAQVAYMVINGVHTTSDALLLNLLPAATYIPLQALLVFRVIRAL